MVGAILREIEVPGTGKTQTRRALNPQPLGILSAAKDEKGVWRVVPDEGLSKGEGVNFRPPRHATGDRPYVREELRFCSQIDGIRPSALPRHEPRFAAVAC